ncbi:MAG: right-handed parallel beta-helix repeat-containing protein, partial [Thiotrichaceae bacterium]
MSHTQLSHQAEVHQVHDKNALQDALSIANSGDTIVLSKEGNYGDISIVNKSGIRITSKSKQLSIQATLSINGASSEVIIENLNIWNDNTSKKQIVLVGKQSKNVVIRHCILSSFPVSMNTLRDKFSGEAKNWINGIRVLADDCDISNNILVNIKLGIQGNGSKTVIQNNIIQYFSADAIRVQHHGIKILKNHIYDSVMSHPGETGHHEAIKLVPPENRLNAGELKGVEVIANVIRSQGRNTYVPKHLQGILQGISGTDGYFIDMTITDNSLVLNSDHGIVLYGAKNLRLSDNKVITAPTHYRLNPGIELYLTRT